MGEREVVVRRGAEGRIGHLVLSRPAKLNALSRAVLDELAEAAAWFDDQPDVSVVVVRGEGRAFSAGFDLADPTWAELGPPETSAAVGRAMAEAVAGMRAVTVAAIQGHCIGGGVVLAAACDLRVAATDARFRIPEVDLGIPLYWAGVPLLVRELGPAVTKELVMTGRAFDADEALRHGFVNRVVPADRLAAAADELAAELAAKAPLVLAATKAQVDAARSPVPVGDGGVAADLAGFAAALRDPDARAAAAAYRRPGGSEPGRGQGASNG
jgi:enoyl-CoA hydratase/carnithine racemase